MNTNPSSRNLPPSPHQELDNQTQELLRALDKLSTEDETGNKVVTSEAIQVRQYLVTPRRATSVPIFVAHVNQKAQFSPLVPTIYPGPQNAVVHAPLSDQPRHGRGRPASIGPQFSELALVFLFFSFFVRSIWLCFSFLSFFFLH